MKKILIILPTLENGGAERLHIYLANEWVKNNYIVEFIILQNRTKLKHLLSNKIKVKILNVNKIRFSFFQLFLIFLFSRPNIIISAMWPLTSIAILAKIFSLSNSKLFTVDHCPYSQNYSKDLNINNKKLFKYIKYTYKFAFKNIVVSQTIKKEFINLANLKNENIVTINNGIFYNTKDLKKNYELKKQLFNTSNATKCIIGIGNLKPQKNFMNLIKATEILIKKNFNIKLFIIGDGLQHNDLKKYILKKNLNKSIIMLGYRENVMPYLSNADLYVNSSDYDGFPLVLIEALISGIKVVSTDCESGPSEILENGKYGTLVPIKDSLSLANAIQDSLFNNYNSKPDNNNIIKKYSIQSVAKKYMRLF